jgi:hypothetical protein
MTVARSSSQAGCVHLRRWKIRRALKDAGVTEDELLESGREISKEVFRERYPDLAAKHGV